MKIIFLDIDGVLNSVQSSFGYKERSYDYAGLSEEGIGLLRELCKITGAKIVVSSTWRHDGHEAIAGAFAAKGWREVVFYKTLIGTTEYPGEGCRGDQIQKWLDGHCSVMKYVIIDDDSDMLESQADNFIHTDGNVGFTLYDMVQAAIILGAKDEKEEKELASLKQLCGYE